MKKLIQILSLSIIFPAAVCAQSLIINEVDADQAGTDTAEFVELFDGGVGNTDLTGLSLVFYNGSDDASYLALDLDGFSTDADGYFVACNLAANVPNCDLDAGVADNMIQNGQDAVALVTGDAAAFPEDTPVSTNNVIDALVYDTGDNDDPALLVLINAGQPQVDEHGNGNKDTESNQRIPNGSGGALNTMTYSQAAPTPGASNGGGVAIELDGSLPHRISLNQNFPNPFNPSTTIGFFLPVQQHVKLSVSDLLGREIAVLIDGPEVGGDHVYRFIAGDLPNGTYLYTLATESSVFVRKMILLK